MIADEARLARAVAALQTRPFTGTTYRFVHPRYASSALSAIGSLRYGGRYNPPGEFEALYLADTPITALLEVEAVIRTSAGLVPVKGPPKMLLSVTLELSSVLDLTDPAAWATLETSLQELSGDWRTTNAGGLVAPTQRLGRAARALGTVEALKVPSSRDLNAHNLVVLPDRLEPGRSRARVEDESGFIAAELP